MVNTTSGSNALPARCRTVSSAWSVPPRTRWKATSRATCMTRSGIGRSAPDSDDTPWPSQRAVNSRKRGGTPGGTDSRSASISPTSHIDVMWTLCPRAAPGSRAIPPTSWPTAPWPGWRARGRSPRRLRSGAEGDRREVLEQGTGPELPSRDLRVRGAARVEQETPEEDVAPGLPVEAQPGRDPVGEQRAVEAVLEGEAHRQVGREAERPDHLRGADHVVGLARGRPHGDATPAAAPFSACARPGPRPRRGRRTRRPSRRRRRPGTGRSRGRTSGRG